MTRQEAKIAANKGEKVTHHYFSKDEFVTVQGGILWDEKNCQLDWDDFWNIRNSKKWQDGWEIYPPTQTNEKASR